jgi:hypothetical protein
MQVTPYDVMPMQCSPAALAAERPVRLSSTATQEAEVKE